MSKKINFIDMFVDKILHLYIFSYKTVL